MDENRIYELDDEQLELVSGGKAAEVYAVKDGCDIRSGPGKAFSVIAKTRKGSVASYTGDKKVADGITWIRVAWDNKSGWVSKEFVKKK